MKGGNDIVNDYPSVCVKVWGPWACFTRPEMKVERVSYEVMTPSAARGVLEAIFWKPEFTWRVQEIHVLNPVVRRSIMRNEVKSKAAVKTVRGWVENGGGFFIEDDRTQRHTLALRDVAYVICADLAVKPRATENEAAYRDQFRRRVAKGQCFHRPCLGCREFAADFCEPEGNERAIDRTEDLGRMLFDLSYGAQGERIVPRFFQARLEKGVLRVPQDLYDGLEGGESHAAEETR